MSEELISRKNVLAQMKSYHDDCAQTSEYTRLGFETAMEVVKAEPSADILDHARAIKEYCRERMKNPLCCNGCPLYGKLCFPHDNMPIPCKWDLPEGEKVE